MSRQLALDVLTLAADGGMPDSFWHTDSRIIRATDELGWTVEAARAWAQGDRS